MKRKVLIVEDEQDICQFMQRMLELKGCQVFTALTAQEGWEIFQREKPEAVSIDILLSHSEFDGIELLRRIRQIDNECLCVMITRIEDKESMDEVKRVGVDGIFIKPPRTKELYTLIDQLAHGKQKGV
ncbi:MAG: response regulator [Candidatus Omnitrophota bacterium]|nr:response regulator [Candidatus Omnitrophota bacterium]